MITFYLDMRGEHAVCEACIDRYDDNYSDYDLDEDTEYFCGRRVDTDSMADPGDACHMCGDANKAPTDGED